MRKCFRWRPQPDGSYLGVALGQAARIWEEGGRLCISGDPGQYERLWRSYFDLDRDYDALDRMMPDVDILQKSLAYGKGLHIFAQDPWEALCSFLFSQCNHIPRIRSIIESLCSALGDPITCQGETLYSFPSAAQIAALSLSDLAFIRAGYRTEYVLAAAQRVAGGFDLNALKRESSEYARTALMSFDGIGRKVADCVLLCGLGKFDSFPVDTWIRKALSVYSAQVDPSSFGDYAGIVQQYLFYYARSMKIGK